MEQLGKHFKTVAKAVLEKHGSAYAEVLANWPVIAGPQLAAISVPEQIRWPRSAGAEKDKGRAVQKLGGTLTVRVLPGRALDVQYAAPQIIDRLNAYWGHAAIAAIKTVQGPLPGGVSPRQQPSPDGPDAAEVARLAAAMPGIAEDRLRQALARLGANIAARGRKPSRP